MKVRIFLFGRFEVDDGQRIVLDEAWNRQKAKALLKILACHPRHELHREELIELLWPNATRDKANNSLRQAVHQLRTVTSGACGLLEGPVQLNGETVTLSPDVQVDIDTFRRAAHEALAGAPQEKEAALALASLPFLPADRYEDWSHPVREEVSELLAGLLRGLMRDRGHRGKYAEALTFGRQLVDLRPLDEEAQAFLLCLYGATHDRAGARKQFATYAANLREVGLQPSPTTERLYRSVLAGGAEEPMSTGDLAAMVSNDGVNTSALPRYLFGGVLVLAVLAAAGSGWLRNAGGSGATSIHEALSFDVEASGEIDAVPNVCTAQDASVSGSYQGAAEGDIAGMYSEEFRITLSTESRCASGIRTGLWSISSENGDIIRAEWTSNVYLTHSITSGTPLIIDSAGELKVVSGTGNYEHARGSGACIAHEKGADLRGDASVTGMLACEIDIVVDR